MGELKERQTTIADKDQKIEELRKRTQELEKFKFVLDYKIKELKAANIQKITPTLPPSFVREADKVFDKKVKQAVEEQRKKPSERKIGDQKVNEEILETTTDDSFDAGVIKDRVTKEINTTVQTMMRDLGAVLKDDQMSELLSKVENKTAFGDIDDIGK